MYVVKDNSKINQLVSQKSDSFAVMTKDAYGVISGKGNQSLRILSRSKTFGQIERIHANNSSSFDHENIMQSTNLFSASGSLKYLALIKFTNTKNLELKEMGRKYDYVINVLNRDAVSL